MSAELQPIEKYLKKVARTNADKFPNHNGGYWERYSALVASLRQHVYPSINAGLACLSKSPGIYTDHGETHFDEVVKYAGLLLENPDKGEPHGLTPYEVYLVLCAIRIHDAGNMEGREQHEQRVSDILSQYGGNIVRDTPEFELIANIAEAHGGLDPLTGGKDTIINLPVDDTPLGTVFCRPRRVAAVVRFADEICEHRGRAASHLISTGKLPEENKLFHYYAASIAGAVPDRKAKSFRLDLAIDTKYLESPYLTPKDKDGEHRKVYLLDEIFNRFCKLDRERMYCNQFLGPELQTDKIDIHLRVMKTRGNRQVQVHSHRLTIPASGYPEASNGWRAGCEELTGEKIAARVKEEWNEH